MYTLLRKGGRENGDKMCDCMEEHIIWRKRQDKDKSRSQRDATKLGNEDRGEDRKHFVHAR
jgi:hypothetical protein